MERASSSSSDRETAERNGARIPASPSSSSFVSLKTRNVKWGRLQFI
jgi:hypothetical protein